MPRISSRRCLPRTAELNVTATALAATTPGPDTWSRSGDVVSATNGAVLARLQERFAIRGRTGDAELADPVRAGGAVLGKRDRYPARRRRRDVTITAPIDMRPFAVVSGDHDPIHTDRAAALLAGSTVADRAWHVVVGGLRTRAVADGRTACPGAADRLDTGTLGMVKPATEVDVRVTGSR